jgi:hypothetical protein
MHRISGVGTHPAANLQGETVMMKFCTLIAMAAVSLSASAQSTAPTTGDGTAVQFVSLYAELGKSLSAKSGKIGDVVEAKTTTEAAMADGTKLPKGTRLVGKVTEVQARSGHDKPSRLGFEFDHAVLRDGSQIPLHVLLLGLMAPEDSSDLNTMAMGAGNPSLGAAGRTAAGGANGGGSGKLPDGSSTAPGALNSGAPAPGKTEANGSINVPLRNLPGVTCTSDPNSNASGVLGSNSTNIYVGRGATMLLGVAVSPKP